MANNRRMALGIVIILMALSVISGTAIAALPPPPPNVPGSPPSGGGDGGGSSGSSGSSGTQPAFQPFTEPLRSSDGRVIGNLTGRSESSILLRAGANATIGGEEYTLVLEEEMARKPPDDARLDVSIEAPDSSGLPPGMSGLAKACLVNITVHSSGGWSVKPGTIKLSLGLPDTRVDHPGITYYMIFYDGSGYHVYNATIEGGDASRLEFFPPADTGRFTLAVAGVEAGTTPVPSTDTSASTPAASPSISGAGEGGFALIALIGAMLAVATVTLYWIFLRRRQ